MSKKSVVINPLIICALMFCSVFNWGAYAKEAGTGVLEKYLFTPSDKPMKKVDWVLAEAKSKGQLAMLVLGAQWCHDSRGLAENFSRKELHALLGERYQIAFIDVGYLLDRRSITQRFGYPNYFGTPTVLIVEPHKELLLNYASVSKWQNAASVPPADYLRYFSQYSYVADDAASATKPLLTGELTTFERRQADRLSQAYAVLGPLLASYDQGGQNDQSQFNQVWKEVKSYRTQLQKDLLELRVSQSEGVGELEAMPEIPRYAPFSWEQ